MSDEHLVASVCSGDTALFEELMRRYNQRVYRVARAIVKDETEAEDVMQQAYLNAFTHLRQFAERAKFSTWLTRIVIHEALGRRRRTRRTEQLSTPSEGDAMHHAQSAVASPERQAMHPSSSGSSRSLWTRSRTPIEPCSCFAKLKASRPLKPPRGWTWARKRSRLGSTGLAP